MSNEEVLEWVNKQAVWVRDAVLTFYNNGKIDEADITRFVDECIEEAKGNARNIFVENIELLDKEEGMGFSIDSIEDISGVNAIASGNKLCFLDKGITVVYGDNGSGKSGYIRIFKQLADAKCKEELKKNIYSQDENGQNCKIKIKDGDGNVRDYICDLSVAGERACLKSIDIFDSKLSQLYVESSKEASYEPWILILLKQISAVADEIKSRLENKKIQFPIGMIHVKNDLEDTDAARIIASINHKTKIDAMLSWNAENDSYYEELKKKSNVDAIKETNKRLEDAIKEKEKLKNYFEKYTMYFSSEHINEIEDKKKELDNINEQLKAAKLLFENNADDIDKAEVSNMAWIELWRAADKYYASRTKEDNLKYTQENSVCPLCHQRIDKQLASRNKSIDDYINGELSRKKIRVEEQLYLIMKISEPWREEAFSTLIDACDLAGKDDYIAVNNIFLNIYDKVEKKNYLKIEKIKIADMIVELCKKIEDDKGKLDINKELLVSKNNKKIEDEIKELEGRKFFSENKDAIKKEITHHKKINVIENAIKLTNTAKITRLSKDLTAELITDEYLYRFDDELKFLTKNNVRVKMAQGKAGKGKIPFKIHLTDINGKNIAPKDILSEGENRVVALAAFFAESGGKTINYPLIVDDPISSLDYTYEERVIQKLVNIAKHRQVIVFTHRISMVVGINDVANRLRVNFSGLKIYGKGNEKGIPVTGTYATNIVGQLKKLRNETLAQLKNMDEYSDAYAEKINYLCQQMRILIERSVEEILLNGVVVRFRRAINTLGKISALSRIDEKDCTFINDMMTKYSYYDHPQPLETPLIDFTLDEIDDDLRKFDEWLVKKKNDNKEKK